MRSFVALLICFCLIGFPARAEEEKLVALTFDDGPSGRFTRALLTGLEQRDAKATFFLCGYRLEQYPSLAQQILNGGHEIGLHGFSHCSMADMSTKDVLQELKKTRSMLPDDCRIAFLRTPGGKSSKAVQDAARKTDLAILNWSIDPQDWATGDAVLIQKRVLSRVQDGAVILMHDMSDSSVTAALAIVDTLQAQGYRFVTISQLAAARGVALVPGKIYTRFPPDK